MLRSIQLHGEMGQRFGEQYEMDVGSLAEATRAIGTQVEGFRKYVQENSFHVFVETPKGRIELDETMIGFEPGPGTIHIAPVIEGAKSSGARGIGKIIAGVLLAAVAWWALPVAGLPLGFFTLTPAMTGSLALSLVVGGVTQMLTKTPKTRQPAAEDPSFMFNGEVNTAEQGVPVPLIYGRTRVGSVVVSSGVSSSFK